MPAHNTRPSILRQCGVLLFSNAKQAVNEVSLVDTIATVYNFTVSEFHTYYVSALGILVHNTSYHPVNIPGGGGAEVNKALKEIVSGQGDYRLRLNKDGSPKTFRGDWKPGDNKHPSWRGAFEYEVEVPGKADNFRILRKLEGVDATGVPIYKYGYTSSHNEVIYPFKPIQ